MKPSRFKKQQHRMSLRFARVKRFRERFSLGKALFVLPNLFTLASIFCAFYALHLVITEPSPVHFYRAGFLIFGSLFFDGADGRVARMTKTQSDFGVQLDSLADVIAFGMTPAFLIHEWVLHELGLPGLLIAFLFASCGALRLARFNVLAARNPEEAKSYFVGLPIPLAAAFPTSLMMFAQKYPPHEPLPTSLIATLVVITSLLMVSNIRYPSFKNAHPGLRTFATFGLALSAFLGTAAYYNTPLALFSMLMIYIVLNALIHVVKLVRSLGSIQS